MRLRETIQIQASPETVWSTLSDIENMTMFSGFGPIPGIASARWIEGDVCRTGAVREVRNRDGSTHREDVVLADPPHALEDRVYGFTSPFRFLVREARDRFELTPSAGGTTLQRTFTLELTSPIASPLAALLLPALHRAVQRHLSTLRDHLAPQTRTAP